MSALWRGGEEKVPMVPLMVTAPPQLVHLNFTSFKMTTNLNELPKVEHVLVIVDNFTRYTRAYVIKDQKASTAAKTLHEGFISIFGAPKRILMDQGKAHQTLGKMIGKLEDEYKGQWLRHLLKLTHAYNSTRSAMTGYLPHLLMFR